MQRDCRPEPTFAERLSGVFMWMPVMILFLWDTIPANCWGNLVYAKMYSLRLGMSSARVLRIAGTPEETMGEDDDYAVWVYRRTTVWTEGETITVSVGMRDKTAVWIRYHYDAADDYSRHTTSGACPIDSWRFDGDSLFHRLSNLAFLGNSFAVRRVIEIALEHPQLFVAHDPPERLLRLDQG